MKTFNGNKMLSIEIYSNSSSGADGYTVWHIKPINNAAMSRRADDKDFDWMTDKERKQFEEGRYKFKISAENALDYFGYMY